jgi:hypothetical protein
MTRPMSDDEAYIASLESIQPDDYGHGDAGDLSFAPDDVVLGDAHTVKLGLFDLIETKGRPGEEKKYRRNLFQQDVVKAFVAAHTGILRYDFGAGQWLFFTGSQWSPMKIQQAVTPFLKRLSVGFDDRQRREMLSVNYAEAIERGARAAPGISTSPSLWDTNLDVIGTPGGVVDLKTGKVGPMTASAMIRKMTAVGLEIVEELAKEDRAIELPDCPTWRWFLKDRFSDDENDRLRPAVFRLLPHRTRP